jgi:hypothetical protein
MVIQSPGQRAVPARTDVAPLAGLDRHHPGLASSRSKRAVGKLARPPVPARALLARDYPVAT